MRPFDKSNQQIFTRKKSRNKEIFFFYVKCVQDEKIKKIFSINFIFKIFVFFVFF